MLFHVRPQCKSDTILSADDIVKQRSLKVSLENLSLCVFMHLGTDQYIYIFLVKEHPAQQIFPKIKLCKGSHAKNSSASFNSHYFDF